MRYLSVCSGMEAASVAWHPLGWTPVGFSEIEPFPCAILKHHFPTTPNYGSLTEYQSWPVGPGTADLLVGGTPCQSFSVAGLRKGLEDPRGNLALVFLGLADRIKPRWIVWENVPGVLSSNGGRDLGSFLGALVQLGYGFAMRVLDAQHFGVPQRRRRVFVVACLGDWRAPAEVLLEPDCVRRDPKKGRAKGQSPAAGAEGGVGADPVCATGERTHALTASQKGATEDGTGRGTPIVIDRAAFNQGQNAQYEPHIEESEVMDSLVARGPHAAGQPIAMRESGQGYWMEDDKAGTLRAEGENRPSRPSHVIGQPGNERVEAEALVAFQPGNLRRQAGADPSTETFPTLKCDAGDQSPHVAYPVVPLDGMNLLSRLGKCVENHSTQNFEDGDPQFTLRKGGTQHGILTPMAVRRLTPVETERLQGFPDNWSRIPWKGKPEEDCPDGPRYKACGNSMAVPVMRWIGARIAAADAKYFPHA